MSQSRANLKQFSFGWLLIVIGEQGSELTVGTHTSVSSELYTQGGGYSPIASALFTPSASNVPWSIVWQMCSKTNSVLCEGGAVGDLEMEDGKPFQSFYMPQGVFDVNSLALSSNTIIGHVSATGLA